MTTNTSMLTRRAVRVLAVLGIAAASSALPGTALAAAPTFSAPVSLAGGCGGEPSIDLDGKGHVYVSSPKGIIDFLASCQGVATSTNGAATWVSNDSGSTFGPMISVGTLNGGGDTDTTVDRRTGNVYVADLEAAAADICVSTDHGQTYHTAVTGVETCSTPFNITGQAGPSNDREWLTLYGPTASYPHQDVYLSYHDFVTGLPEFFISQDGGPFLPSLFPAVTDPTFASAAANGTIIAKPVLDAAGDIYELVTTQNPANGPLTRLFMVKSTDHGQTFTDTLVFDGSAAPANLGLVFNDLAIDGAGNLYALVLGNTQGSSPPDNAYLFTSTDKGASWSRHQVATDGKALALPALHGGPLAGQLVLGWYHSTNTTDTNDLAGQWRYDALESTDANSAAPTFTSAVLGSHSNPATGIVHQGQICTAGTACTTGQLPPNPPGDGNRNLADFSSVTVDQGGCAIFAYPDDGKILPDQSNFDFSLVNNNVARQTSGCFATTLVTTAAPTPTPVANPSPSPSPELVNTSTGGPPPRTLAGVILLLVAGLSAPAIAARAHRSH